MGRYYEETDNHSFEGKFWFGIQNSNASERFGGSYYEPNHINYTYNEDDLEKVSEELDAIEEWIESQGVSVDDNNLNSIRQSDTQSYDAVQTKWVEPIWDLANDTQDKTLSSELADYELGCKIEWTIKRYGHMNLECEL